MRKGDFVQKGEAISEAEIDKTVIDILAPENGYIEEICIPNGGQCDIHRPIAFIAESVA